MKAQQPRAPRKRKAADTLSEKGNGASKVPSPDALHAQITQRAYELYEQRGREHGHDVDDWREAERQVLGHRG